jgi:hypothetical protein
MDELSTTWKWKKYYVMSIYYYETCLLVVVDLCCYDETIKLIIQTCAIMCVMKLLMLFYSIK